MYLHEVQYYETDAMKIVHHSNYIRWFEEARMDLMQKADLNYAKLEERGIIIPVLSASCEYKMAVRYGETVKILAQIEGFNGLRFSMSYRVVSMDETVLHATGVTSHCFLNQEMKPISVKKIAPDIYSYFKCHCINGKKVL